MSKLILTSWIVAGVFGYGIGEGSKRFGDYNPYYYCAARYDTCIGLQWTIYATDERRDCCCNQTGGATWTWCELTFDVYKDATFSHLCYKLKSVSHTEEICEPLPVAAEPIEPLYSADSCCKMRESATVEMEIDSGAKIQMGKR